MIKGSLLRDEHRCVGVACSESIDEMNVGAPLAYWCFTVADFFFFLGTGSVDAILITVTNFSFYGLLI